jgi:NAD+ synthetase
MRITLAQLNTTVGDVAGNTRRILDALSQAEGDGASMLVCSEMAISGSPTRDLLFRAGFVESCELAVRTIAERTRDVPVVVGHPRRVAHGLRPYRNSVSVCRRGEIVAVYDKRLLPGYDVFDDDRYFDPGEELVTIDVAGQRVGLLICEDLWRADDAEIDRGYDTDPVGQLSRAGCDLIVAVNASPFVRGKGDRHLEILRNTARTIGAAVVGVNQVGGNDDLVFDGRSTVVAAGGEIWAMLPAFEECVRTVDLEAAPSAPAAMTVPAVEETINALTHGVRDYFQKTGHREAVLGLSGGIDSALTAALAVRALGPERLTGLIMPSRYSSALSHRDAEQLANNLQMQQHVVSIEDSHDMLSGALETMVGADAGGVADENLQARLRGMLLMAYANARGAMVLSTSNKSEIAVGYSTLYGDMCGAVCVLGDVLKTDVYEMARWINANAQRLGFDGAPIPQSSIDRPPSAELRPNQTDQDTLPPYELLDDIIRRYVEQERSVYQIIEEGGLEEALVRTWTQRIDLAQYKRDQASVILKVSRRAFGRGRPMPIVMRQTSLENVAIPRV